jgi:hypothetical protein
MLSPSGLLWQLFLLLKKKRENKSKPLAIVEFKKLSSDINYWGGEIMRKIIISIFLVLTFLCSTAMSETAVDWFRKA